MRISRNCRFKRSVIAISLLGVLSTGAFLTGLTINGRLYAAPNETVSNERELSNASFTVPRNGTTYVIEIANDITLISTLAIPSGANITLTGKHELIGANGQATITVASGGVLTIDGITVTHAIGVGGDSHGVYVNSGGRLNLLRGTISRNVAPMGGGVYSEGVFTMSGGTISENKATSGSGDKKGIAWGGGVYNVGGTFTMSGGTISGNSAEEGGGVYNAVSVSLSSAFGTITSTYVIGTFTMSGGIISGNTASNGGGVLNSAGDFIMSGGEISNNTVTSGGGGVHIVGSSGSSNSTDNRPNIPGAIPPPDNITIIPAPPREGTFTMSGGIISSNISAGDGGGVLNVSKFTMNGGIISDNIASRGGGGVYNWGYGAFSMKEGVISGNSANYGGGVYNGNFPSSGISVPNEVGTFTMSGGTISRNISTNRAISGTASIVGGGGGVYNEGDFTMYSGYISNNDVSGYYGSGGGVYNRGTFKMTGGWILENAATDGGGILNAKIFTMSGGTISNNTAISNGGGVCNGIIANNSSTSYGVAMVNWGIISSNTANNGGGIWTHDLSNLKVAGGVVFSGNYASVAYDRNPSDDATYVAQIGNNVKWTDFFTQGYNNYDISYTSGTQLVFITFMRNYDDTDIDVIDQKCIPVGTTIGSIQSNLSRSSYVFIGWNTTKNGSGTDYVASSLINVSIVLYAQWGSNCNVTYVGNGNTSGFVPTDQTSYAYGSMVTTLGNTGNLAREDYTFIGWAASPTATVATYAVNSVFPITSEITLYAIWEQNPPITYMVTVEGSSINNNSSGAGIYTPGVTVTIRAGTRTGYTFSHWTVSTKSGTIMPLIAQADTTTLTMPPDDVVVTANWILATPAIDDDSVENTTDKWSPVNMTLAIVGGLVALASAVRVIRKKDGYLWMAISVIAGIGGIGVFLCTQRINGSVIMVNWWTIANTAILIIDITFAGLSIKSKHTG